MRNWSFGLVAAGAIVALSNSPTLAGSATGWIKANHVMARLVVDAIPLNERDPSIVAGVHLKLDEGWKTYWRYPGDAGLPPNFDWSKSKNLKQARVLWPAPVRLRDSAGTSYGYKQEVVFPVMVEPVDRTKPVELHLKLDYAVCADICIPAEADLMASSGKSGFFTRSYAPLLEKYLKRVPVRVESGKEKEVGVQHAHAQLNGNKPELVFDIRFSSLGDLNDLFVEGPEGFYLPPTKRESVQADGTVRFRVDLTKADDPADLKGKSVILTLVSDDIRAEMPWRVD